MRVQVLDQRFGSMFLTKVGTISLNRCHIFGSTDKNPQSSNIGSIYARLLRHNFWPCTAKILAARLYQSLCSLYWCFLLLMNHWHWLGTPMQWRTNFALILAFAHSSMQPCVSLPMWFIATNGFFMSCHLLRLWKADTCERLSVAGTIGSGFTLSAFHRSSGWPAAECMRKRMCGRKKLRHLRKMGWRVSWVSKCGILL